MKTLSENLKLLRKHIGCSQSEISYMFEFSGNSWENFESGKGYPNIQELTKISLFFKISESNLIHELIQKEKLVVIENPRLNYLICTTNMQEDLIISLINANEIQAKAILKLKKQLADSIKK